MDDPTGKHTPTHTVQTYIHTVRQIKREHGGTDAQTQERAREADTWGAFCRKSCMNDVRRTWYCHTSITDCHLPAPITI